ncbi:polynucleotide kinase [Citrobacter phage Miller]|uniref:Polynucleotide kinase n=1 Tax=Citrobacter phage Miller TaxID=1527524 RepID=A0A076YJP3_9CAUD|nr:polynucleotide kinase [Citrobacter phage Miller]AIK68007.1 polynucleotide kinase [Citrobacter phage Miller]
MNLIITVGVPGSGKTTWAKEKAREMGNTLTVSRDDIRRTLYCAGGDLTGYRFTEEKENLVTKLQADIVLNALASGKNVIVHNTHLKKGDHVYWKEIAKYTKADFHIEWMDADIVELLKRNHKRGVNALPVSRLWEMFEQYRKLRGWVPAMQFADPSKPKCVIFDVDGTLTKVGQRSPYDFTKVIDDPANPPVQELFRMYKAAGYACVVVSGREGTEQCAHDTKASLTAYDVDLSDGIFMREEGDHRHDFYVKEQILVEKILDKYYPVLAVDDRDTPVGMWRMNGIPCFQVDYGDF